jgi:membrane-bound lytic murein transglycosylase D
LRAGLKTNKESQQSPCIRALQPSLIALAVATISACSQAPVQEQVASEEPAEVQITEQPPLQNETAITITPEIGMVDIPTAIPEELVCTPETDWAWIEPGYEDIWTRVRAGLQLQLNNENPRVVAELNWFGRHQDYIDRVVDRASLYLYYVVDEIEQKNVPMELALLPIVESAYDPFAYSHGRASGMWQFIPGTGKYYGLKQNWWYDGRRDIRASTKAAIQYLSELSKRYDGDWELALAAYNAGPGNVDRAIRRNKKAGKPTDFWSLQLPRETRAYVPRLLAVAKIIADPEAYNVALKPVPNQPYFHAVNIGSQIDLAEAAKLGSVSIEDLYRLNPGFNRWATDPRGPFELLLPAQNADDFAQNLSQLAHENRVNWEQYKVKSGDNLGAIASRHKTSVSAITRVNQLSSNTIRIGQRLMIPMPSKGAEHYSLSVDQRLASIQSNTRGKQGRDKVTHQVRRGDSMWKISRKYRVSIKEIAKWNGMSPKDTLRPGMKLSIWTDSASAGQTRSSSNPLPSRQHIRKVGYTVRSGDSLARIASRFNVNLNDILKWNPLDRPEYLRPGQSLTLYVDVTNVN